MKISTYDELYRFVDAFADGSLRFLIVSSRGGLGKTHTVREALQQNDHLLFNGHATPLSIYKELYYANPNLTVFDDVDSLLSNKTSVSLLKQICDTSDERIVKYTTTAGQAADVPNSYKTATRVILLTNDLKRTGKNLGALLSRAVVLDFDPTPQEVYDALSRFARDEEVLSFLKGVMSRIRDFNLRVYEKASMLKDSGIDWKDWIRREYGVLNERALYDKLVSLPTNDAIDVFRRETGKSRRSYYRFIKKYEGI